jgi:hypothetical protein
MTYRRTNLMSPKELADLTVYRDQCLGRGLATGPLDRPAAEEAVRRVYATAGLTPPPVMIWMDSPLGGLFAAGVLAEAAKRPRPTPVKDQLGGQLWGQLRGQLRGQLGGQLWDQLRGQLGGQLWDQLRGQLWDQLRDQLGDQLWGQLRDQLRGQLGGQLWDQLGGQLWDQLGDQLGDQLRGQMSGAIWGSQELPWLAFYAFGRQLGAQYNQQANDRLDAMLATGDLGWWWPYRGWCILTDRPTELHRDPQNRLHHETGPAVAYADGWAVHAWHGTRVPADLIAGKWTTADILKHPNAEVRRCAIEHMGWDRFITDAGLHQVGRPVPDPGNPGYELTLYDVPEQIYDEPVRVLLCANATVERDGTRRRFGLTVPADIQDPLHAAAWTFDLDPADYAGLTNAY